MIGSFLTRGLVMIFGYAYPAYECYKTVEMNKPEVEQLRFWCQYWILVAMMAVCERISDILISWVPMYSEAKLAFYIYLWYPKTKGSVYVYDSFIKPYIVKHEKDIDRNLMELKTRAGDMIVMYFQKGASYGQTRVFEVLQYVASQPFPRPYQQNQPQKQAPKATRQPTIEELPSPTSSTSSSQYEEELEQEEVGTSPAPSSPVVQRSSRKLTSAAAKSVRSKPEKKATPHSNNLESSKSSAVKKITPEPPENTDESANEDDPEQTEPAPSSPPRETAMEDAIHATRGRLRKSRSVEIKKDA